MKKFLVLSLVLGFVAVTAHLSYATHIQTNPGDLAGGIADSRHNFSSSGVHYRVGDTTTDNRSDDLADGLGTTEICVFCHTPHHGDKGSGPLWNKDAGDASSYAAYGTMDTGQAGPPSPGPGSSSLACLSCHDGTKAWDNIINTPGKGTWNGTVYTSGITGAGANMGWQFSEDGVPKGNKHDDTVSSRHNLAREGLTNDHPINIVYRGAGYGGGDDLILGPVASLRDSVTDIATIDLSSATQGAPLVCADRGDANCNMWAINGFIKTDAKIEDILKAGNKVECLSCHDVHYRNQTNPEIDITYGQTIHATSTASAASNDVDGLFLRRVGGNSDSGVCRTCHAK
jgi:hypothetical protein